MKAVKCAGIFAIFFLLIIVRHAQGAQTPEEARSLLERKHIEYNDASFFKVIKSGNVNAVRIFLNAGMNPNIKDKNSGATPLHWVVLNKNIEIVKELLKNNAEINAKNNDGDTPLLQTVMTGQTDILNILLKNGSDVNAKNNNGDSSLLIASFWGKFDVLKLLLLNGANIYDKDKNGYTAIHLAIYRQFGINKSDENIYKIVSLLLNRGAKINLKSNIGITPLMQAAIDDDYNIAKLLIKKGADINVKTNDRATALDIAIINKNRKIATLLQSKGAKPNITNKKILIPPIPGELTQEKAKEALGCLFPRIFIGGYAFPGVVDSRMNLVGYDYYKINDKEARKVGLIIQSEGGTVKLTDKYKDNITRATKNGVDICLGEMNFQEVRDIKTISRSEKIVKYAVLINRTAIGDALNIPECCFDIESQAIFVLDDGGWILKK